MKLISHRQAGQTCWRFPGRSGPRVKLRTSKCEVVSRGDAVQTSLKMWSYKPGRAGYTINGKLSSKFNKELRP